MQNKQMQEDRQMVNKKSILTTPLNGQILPKSLGLEPLLSPSHLMQIVNVALNLAYIVFGRYM